MRVWAVIAVVLDGVAPFSYVLAGWMSALPMPVWGWRLRGAV
ncbi:MAG: hypothetical protein ACRD12_04510 [Acidimicrobiales bacterium]